MLRKTYKFLLALPVAMLVMFGLFGNVKAETVTYTVKPGDTLCNIGKQFNIPCKDMVANFPQSNPNLIHPGDKFEFGRADGLLGGLVSKPYTFSPNTVISSAQINSNFDTLYGLVNGNLSNTNINASAGISSSKIEGTSIVSTGQASQIIYGGVVVSTTSNVLRVPVMTAVQKTALGSVDAGSIIYVSDEGQFYVREGGSWAAISPAGETALASTTTKGIVELATNSEVELGTANGGTGAPLVLTPTQWLEYSDTHFSNNLPVGESVAAYNVLYISSTGQYMIAHANVQAEVDRVVGVVFESVSTSSYPRVYFPGSIIYSTSGMATGSPVYLSDTGTASTTAGTIRKVLGIALGTNVWQLNFLSEQTSNNPASSSANTIPLTNASSTLRGWSGAFGGDGTDGALDVTTGTTTINLGGSNIVVKQYNSINISAGALLNFSNPASDGTYIILKSRTNCTIAGTINAVGMGAATNTRGFGYLENAQAYNAAVTNTVDNYANSAIKLWQGKTATLVGSGGGASANVTNTSFGGGSVRIECADGLNFTGTINVNGQPGRDGVDATEGAGSGAGEAGGGGGSFLGLYNRLIANSGTITFAGGIGGQGGDGFCHTVNNNSDNGATGLIGGGSYLGAGGAGGASRNGASNLSSCSAGLGGAGGATNGAAGSQGSAGSQSGGGGLGYGGPSGGGGAGAGGFGNWFKNYWFN